jgi:ribonuclease BN (tRNA processing enzyme)
MRTPYFPVNLADASAQVGFAQMKSSRIKLGDVSVESFPLNHPQGAYGYRVEAGGKSVVYATDLEHGDPHLDRTLRDFASGADVLIYDAQYDDAEYTAHRGWGHSTWREATRVAKDAGVGKLFLFHFDPTHTDTRVAESERLAAAEFENSCAAREGSVILL